MGASGSTSGASRSGIKKRKKGGPKKDPYIFSDYCDPSDFRLKKS